MRITVLTRVSCALLVFGMAYGCATDREAAVTGNWKAKVVTSREAAFQAKQDNPSASASELQAAGRAVSNAAIELRKDKSFDLSWQGKKIPGTWSFNKESGEVRLELGSAPGQQPFEARTWTAYLSQDNRQLQLYTAAPELAQKVKKDAGPLSDGVVLEKSAD